MRLPAGFQRRFAALSDHVVYSSGLYVDLRSQIHDLSSALVDFERAPRSDADRRCRRVAELLRPLEIDADLIRVGGPRDGAYVMADDFAASAAVSVGVGHDVSWDIAVAARGLPVHLFDPTVAGPPEPVANATFSPIGLGTPGQAVATGLPLKSLSELVADCGFGLEDEVLLKIDIEGAEWEALDADPPGARFRQVVLELHDLDQIRDDRAGERIVRVLERLHSTHAPVHLHGNNDAPFAHFDAYWFPTVVEASFVRRDGFSVGAAATDLREDLDAPSNPRFRDVSLRGLLTL